MIISRPPGNVYFIGVNFIVSVSGIEDTSGHCKTADKTFVS